MIRWEKVNENCIFANVNLALVTLTIVCAMAAMNSLFEPEHGQFWILLIAEVITGAVYALLARALFGFAERSAQRNGRFDLF